ncbi:zinc ABC transporter substrate-binding protein [Rhizobiaceae bacterium BDR2-2]|uniref:High-affinity zinc uptake system protein ZnuA n=1 Tax=Ectorhizobium quercum TaxID=2965071 RepID=A0AAE3N4I6_9HYPH|nr:zinc ABC transporter substrate-binding protein [Ectorhizobium quercum]MCX8999796.1 zinc ABC transporter substrate-binding protein [Ectorhizobium quercum]
MKIPLRLLAGAVLLSAGAAHAAEPPAVIASFKPLHSLVAGVMQGVAEPELLIDTNASPHTYTMKPSNAALMEKADVVFWIGPDFERFLEKPLHALASGAKSVELSEAPGVSLLDLREGGTFEKHVHDAEEGEHHDHAGESHDHDHGEEAGHDDNDDHDHAHGGKDMHLWLDPENARAMTREIVRTLAEADPANAAAYERNGTELDERLAALDKELAETLAPVRDKPFVVFHDAFQYMEHHYDLTVAGSITVNPELMPGAARIRDIREKIVALGATCVFSEPSFEPKIVTTLVEGTPAKAGELNPEGGALPAGPELYFDLMRQNAAVLTECLGGE